MRCHWHNHIVTTVSIQLMKAHARVVKMLRRKLNGSSNKGSVDAKRPCPHPLRSRLPWLPMGRMDNQRFARTPKSRSLAAIKQAWRTRRHAA